jgi:hypothetical protein
MASEWIRIKVSFVCGRRLGRLTCRACGEAIEARRSRDVREVWGLNMHRWDGLGTGRGRCRAAALHCWCRGHGDCREASGIRTDTVDPRVARLGSIGCGQNRSWACHLASFDCNIILGFSLRCALATPSYEYDQNDQEEHDND